MTGNIMRNAANAGVLSAPRKRKAISITDITGVADIIEKRGERKAPALLSMPAAMPKARPAGTEIIIPVNTLKKVLAKTG
jgi:hypothetical protein